MYLNLMTDMLMSQSVEVVDEAKRRRCYDTFGCKSRSEKPPKKIW